MAKNKVYGQIPCLYETAIIRLRKGEGKHPDSTVAVRAGGRLREGARELLETGFVSEKLDGSCGMLRKLDDGHVTLF